MEEAIAVNLPRQIHDDIVVLQGQEIIRIRELLQTSEVGAISCCGSVE
jgi:nucleolar pre-ribosomal-associated protein 1